MSNLKDFIGSSGDGLELITLRPDYIIKNDNILNDNLHEKTFCSYIGSGTTMVHSNYKDLYGFIQGTSILVRDVQPFGDLYINIKEDISAAVEHANTRMSSFVNDDEIIIGTGWNEDSNNPAHYKDIFKFNTRTQELTQMADFPDDYQILSFGYNPNTGKVIAAGGYDRVNGAEVKKIYEYDVANDSWSLIKDIGNGIDSIRSGFIMNNNNDIFLYRNNDSIIYKYDIANDTLSSFNIYDKCVKPRIKSFINTTYGTKMIYCNNPEGIFLFPMYGTKCNVSFYSPSDDKSYDTFIQGGYYSSKYNSLFINEFNGVPIITTFSYNGVSITRPLAAYFGHQFDVRGIKIKGIK